MTQDVVTARDIATPADVTPRLPDAQLICKKLDEALAAEAFDRANYSSSVKDLFQQAWAVATHKRSRQVTIHHLAYALVFGHPNDGKELAEYLESDVDSFAVGCILQILPLGVATGDQDILPPAIATVRWLGKAVALAREKGRPSELRPNDLVRAVLDGRLLDPDYGALRRAARVGNARHDAVLGPRSVQSLTAAPSSSRDIIKHMEEVETKAADSDPDITDLLTMLEELKERYSANIDDQKRALSRIEAALPRPPSGAPLAAAILAVLALGVAAGVALTFLQPQSRSPQAVSASVK